MRGADQSSWYAFARRLADQGYLVLTFDSRGTCPGGEGDAPRANSRSRSSGTTSSGRPTSSGPRGHERRAGGREHGRDRILVAAAQEGTDAEVVVTLSAPISIEGLVADPTLLQQVGANKLFIAGVGDAAAAADAEELYATSPPPSASRSCRPTTTAPTC